MTDPPKRLSLDANALNRVMSHGRGGAGNIAPDANGYRESPEDVRVPTLKTPVYTTGRGGTGNMARNDPEHPEKAREAQDVDRLPQRSSMAEFHGGRGGAGNVFLSKEVEEEERRIEAEKRRVAEEVRAERERVERERVEREEKEKERRKGKGDCRGWADRGKDLLRAKFGWGKSKEVAKASS